VEPVFCKNRLTYYNTKNKNPCFWNGRILFGEKTTGGTGGTGGLRRVVLRKALDK